MTNRERFLAILDGRPPDRIPWIPRLLLWYNAHVKAGTLPRRYCAANGSPWPLREIQRDLGVADNVMPGSKIERVRRITEMVTAWGEYGTGVARRDRLSRGDPAVRDRSSRRMTSYERPVAVRHLEVCKLVPPC